MNPSFEHIAVLIVVVGIIALLSAAANVVQIIVAFRRKPPAEAQFADAQVNVADHLTIHRRISDLRDENDRKFVTKEFLASLETVRSDDRKAIFKQLHELTIAVSDLAARLDERRTK